MDAYRKRLRWSVIRTAQETASALKNKIDRRVLRRTFDALDEDHELEEFFECIPDFCSSKEVDDPKRILAEMDDRGFKKPRLTDALIRFWGRTLTSGFVSEQIKKQRLVICVKAADSARLSGAVSAILEDIYGRGVDGVLQSVEIGHSLGSWVNNHNEGSALCAQGIASGIIASVPAEKRDSHWEALVMDQLGVSEYMLREYLTHGDSVLFANLIHITHQFFRSYDLDADRSFRTLHALSKILRAISGFEIQNTLPGLKHDFCALWNEIVQKAQIPGADILVDILREIRHIYIALHQGTDSAPTVFSASTRDYDFILYQLSSYPSCHTPGHEVVIGVPEETGHASAVISTTVPHPRHHQPFRWA